MDPATVYARLYQVLTSTPVIPVWDDAHDLHIEPLTHEEATTLARTLTVHILETYTERPAA